MLSELRLANFRCFDDEVTLRIRPITILIGKNNAGKSSLIKFLLMLLQSANGPPGSYLNPNGTVVILGRLDDLRNRVSRKRNLQFDLRAKEMGSPSDKFFDLARNRSPQRTLRTLEYLIRVSVNYKKNLSHGEVLIQSIANNRIKNHYKSAIATNSVFLREIKPGRGKMTYEEENQLRLGGECAYNIAESLGRIAYLSAARGELLSEITQYGLGMGYVGEQGEDTLSCLWGERILNDRRKEFLLRHTKAILNIDDLEIVEGQDFVVINARNSETGAKTKIGNFGFGVSQCLPIFVQGLMMDPHSQLIVEQPEAQVHPTAQLGLASFFVDLWNEREVGSIIETHSGNLILRLQHEVARGNLKPEDVSIAYLSLDDSGTNPTPIIKNLDIKPDGSLQEGLPMEFFGGDLTEVFDFMKEQAGQDFDE